MTVPTDTLPGHACQVFRAEDFYVLSGVNQGDGLAPPDEVCAGDLYELDDTARPRRLMLEPRGTEAEQAIAGGSEIGVAGEAVYLVAGYTFLSTSGETVEVLLIRHPVAGGNRFYVLPLSPMARRSGYALVATDLAPVATRLSDLVCVSFARGTQITLASGRQCAIEDLAPGQRVLTRDHGAQPIRWIGRATLRAVGAFAPVVIGKGALGNASDLIVSQHHRMFLYHRARSAGLPTAEVLVQAKHLVDNERVFLREGGVVDYFSLVFDRHEIVYAEGIPAESLMVTEATVARLPADMAEAVRARFPGLSQHQHFGTEAGRQIAARLAAPMRRAGQPAP